MIIKAENTKIEGKLISGCLPFNVPLFKHDLYLGINF